MASPCVISANSECSGYLFYVFFFSNAVLSGEQKKKELIIPVRVEKKNMFIVITLRHHSTRLVMTICDPRDRFFYPTLTLMMDLYIFLL